MTKFLKLTLQADVTFITSLVIAFLIKDHIVHCDHRPHPKDDEFSLKDEDRRQFEAREATEPLESKFGKNFTEEMDKSMSCEDFIVNSTFDPLKVIDIAWQIWYIWNPQYEEPFAMKFSIPSKILIDRFRVELDKDMKTKVDWDDAVLFMESTVDFSALFIKTDVDGLFDVVPSLAFEYYHIQALKFALKTIDPQGYLAIVNCKYRLAYALAPVDNMPPYQKYDEESKKIGYRSSFGRSHIDFPDKDPKYEPHFDHHQGLHDDDEEDLHLEYLNQYNADMDSKIL